MKKPKSLGTVERERERESCILESKCASLLSDLENINNINNSVINFINENSKAMCFSES